MKRMFFVFNVLALITLQMVLGANTLQAQSKKEKKAIAESTKADAYAVADCKCRAGLARIESKQMADNMARARDVEAMNEQAEKFEAKLKEKYDTKRKDWADLFIKTQEEARDRLESCVKYKQTKTQAKSGKKPVK